MSSYPPPPGSGGGPSYPPPPPPPGGGGYGYGPAPADNQATWALVLAIVSLVMVCCCGILGIAGGVAAIVMAHGLRKRAAQYGPGPDTSTANAAFWIGITAVALGSVSLLASFFFTAIDLWTTL